MEIHHVQPIEVLHLFPVLDRELAALLRSLSDADWQKQTIASKWQVKDIAAHLLDGNLRGLSIVRDSYMGLKPEVNSYSDLVAFLNELNAAWTSAAQRLSPRILTDLLETTGREYSNLLTILDPWADAVFPVAWAGEEISKNWFHIAREYTEKWLHQQQIRDAVGRQGIMTKELFFPFIDTFMCALPHTFRNVDVPTGTSVEVVVTSDIGGAWHVNKTDEGWVLRKTTRLQSNARVTVDPDTAWKLFSKGIKPEAAMNNIRMEGNEQLCKAAMGMVSVMA